MVCFLCITTTVPDCGGPSCQDCDDAFDRHGMRDDAHRERMAAWDKKQRREKGLVL